MRSPEIVENLGGHRPGRGDGVVRRGVRPRTDSVISPSSRVHAMSVPSPVNENLLSQRLGALGSARSWAPNVLPELERFIRTADDYDLFRVNPIQYGGLVDLSKTDAIELFVHAAKVGLFEMDWLLICAYCPQVAGSFRELDQVHPRFQCAFCNAINDVALDDYIQVTFTVSGGVRDIIFRHPEMLSVEDFLPALQLFQGLYRSARDDAPAARCRALTGVRRYRGP